MIDLKDKVILVTGGSRGIGAGIVRTLATARGAVVLHYNRGRSEAEVLASALGGEHCHLIQADLSDPASPTMLWHGALAWKGRIDVLVNNAAIRPCIPDDASFEDSDRIWTETLRINLIAPAHLCRFAIAHFRERGGGTIINIASRPAFRGDRPPFLHDGAAKGAIVSLTRGIARWYGADNVTAFVLVPGLIRTQQMDDFVRHYGQDDAVSEIGLGEVGTPKDVADVVAFLASGLARYSTGATIDIGGASYLH